MILQIKRKLADSYYSVIQMTPVETRPLVKELYRYFELGNLKAILRGLVTVSVGIRKLTLWDRVREVLFPLGTRLCPARTGNDRIGQCACGSGFIARDAL